MKGEDGIKANQSVMCLSLAGDLQVVHNTGAHNGRAKTGDSTPSRWSQAIVAHALHC